MVLLVSIGSVLYLALTASPAFTAAVAYVDLIVVVIYGAVRPDTLEGRLAQRLNQTRLVLRVIEPAWRAIKEFVRPPLAFLLRAVGVRGV